MRLTIGKKFNLLLSVALVASVFGTMLTATDLFTSDLSFLLERSALEIAHLQSGRIQSEMRRIAERAQFLGAASLEEFRFDEDRLRFIEESLKKDDSILALGLYRRTSGPFIPSWRVSGAQASAQDLEKLDQIHPLDLEGVGHGAVDVRLGEWTDHSPTIRMALPFVEQSPGIFSQVLVLDLRRERFGSLFTGASQYTSFLLDKAGTILETTDPVHFHPGENLSELRVFPQAQNRTLASQKSYRDRSGVLQVGAFQKIGFADLAVLTQAPASRIEEAERSVYLRTASLGGIFLFLAMLISLQVSRAIAGPIQALSAATARVAKGDFDVRVPLRGDREGKGDEIALLAGSFNTMAGKISELMVETAQKARMEKELETAKTVQNIFFPNRSFRDPRFQLGGSSDSASECGGDWWQYRKIGDYLIVIMGDVTGHGVSAALVTAAAHSSFSVLCSLFEQSLQQESVEAWIVRLLENMNLGIFSAASGRSAMTMVISVIELSTGKAYSANAGHRPPLLLKPGQERPRLLTTEPGQALGESPALKIQVSTVGMARGDQILWYTDGLVECVGTDGRSVSKTELVEQLVRLTESQPNHNRRVCAELIGWVKEKTERTDVGLHDDITVALGTFKGNGR